MTPAYQCPKTHGSNFVHVADVWRYEPRSFLWWSWVARVRTGAIVRCTDHACGRYWRVTLDGVHEPAGSRAAPPTDAAAQIEREPREEREPQDPLDAVRRPSV